MLSTRFSWASVARCVSVLVGAVIVVAGAYTLGTAIEFSARAAATPAADRQVIGGLVIAFGQMAFGAGIVLAALFAPASWEVNEN
jgi:uncharacterized membrane protein YedE/YeeE